jgi:predicted  nucleic acid-binding Zn-ribbon protein
MNDVASNLSIVVAGGGLAAGLLLYIWRKNEHRLDRLEAAVNQITALNGYLPALIADAKEHNGRLAALETKITVVEKDLKHAVSGLEKDMNHAFEKIRAVANTKREV